MSDVNEQPGPVSSGVADLELAPGSVADAQLIRRQQLTHRVLASTLAVLALAALWYLYDGGIGAADLVLAVALTALVLTLYVRHDTTTALTRNRLEREASIRRIVTGLSRSVSADSVVDTVITDLRRATDADHVVVARVREDDSVEVTLVAAQADAPPSRTTLRPEIDARGALPGEETDEGTGEALGGAEEASGAAEEIARRWRSEYGL